MPLFFPILKKEIPSQDRKTRWHPCRKKEGGGQVGGPFAAKLVVQWNILTRPLTRLGSPIAPFKLRE